MAGAIIENLSGKKLAVLVGLLGVGQLVCFLLGGLIAPSPTSLITVLGTRCLDKGYNESIFYVSRGKNPCNIIKTYDDPKISNQPDVTGNNIIFTFQIPLPKDGIILDFSRWQQSLISMIMIDVPPDKKDEYDSEAMLTIDAKLAYRNKGDDGTDWIPLAKSVEERKLTCDLEDGTCSYFPMFELGSLHHDYYLLNLRLPNRLAGVDHVLNKFSLEIEDMYAVFIHQNGGFTKVWVSLKTIFLPMIIAIMAWFWDRVTKLARPVTLLEYMLMCLGGALTLLNVPLEYLSLLADCPWMTLVGDLRLGLFYATLLSFWLIFTGEHLMDDIERNRIQIYWRHLSAVFSGCLCLFVFDMCERGVQLRNPFYSIWVTESGTNVALTFIIIAAICASFYFCFLSYMVYKVFVNISQKRKSLPAMASSRRLKYEGIIYRFKALMLATLLCAAVTVISFIMGQASESQKMEDPMPDPTSAFLTGVYGMWNIYTFALICFYAPSHKKWPKEEVLEQNALYIIDPACQLSVLKGGESTDSWNPRWPLPSNSFTKMKYIIGICLYPFLAFLRCMPDCCRCVSSGHHNGDSAII